MSRFLDSSDYIFLAYLPPAIPMAGLILLYNVLATYFVCNKLERRRSNRVPAFVAGIIQVTFKGGLVVKRRGPHLKDKDYQLFGYPAPPGLVNSLGLLTIVIWITVILAFWAVFFSPEVTITCPDDGKNSTFTRFNFVTTNCEPGELDIEQVVYKPAYNYISGISAGGGLLVLTIVMLHGEMAITMWLIKKKNRQPSGSRNRRRWKLLLIVTELTFVLVLLFLCLTLNVASLFRLKHTGIFLIKVLCFDGALIQTTYYSTIVLYYNWYALKTPNMDDPELGLTETCTNSTGELSMSFENIDYPEYTPLQ